MLNDKIENENQCKKYLKNWCQFKLTFYKFDPNHETRITV
jgi:hypothetical protein